MVLWTTWDGRAEVGALVVLKRKEGLLLALPAGTLPEEVLEQGNAGGDSLTFGPSTVVRLPGIVLDGGSQQPAGEEVSVLIVDCTLSVLGYLREIRAFEEINYNFAEDSPYVLPASEALITAALEWVEAAEQDRVGYYSAESNVEDQSFVEPQPKGKVRPRKPVEKATLSGGGAKAGEKPKKATTASLAADLQLVLQSLPKLAEQVSEIGQRQKTFESQITDRLSSARPQLSQPLSRLFRLWSGCPSEFVGQGFEASKDSCRRGARDLDATETQWPCWIEGVGDGEATQDNLQILRQQS